jgi:CDP-glucose 4,6-dehydratase
VNAQPLSRRPGADSRTSLEHCLALYKNRRVLLTGHTGFKGSWLALWLDSLGAEVLGLSLDPPGAPSMYETLRLDALVAERRVDIRDFAALHGVMRDFAPDIVLHLAALALVRPSYVAPLTTLDTNVMGTANVLEACRLTPSVRSVVIVTSDKCYRNNEWVWGYRENDPMGGHDPYSASKGCAELVTASFTASFFPAGEYGRKHHVAVASVRAGNAVGGGDWGADRLVPDCIRALHEGRPVRIRYPSAVRPWQHVLECAAGYLMLGASLLECGPRFSGPWNLAPIDMGDIWPVERVVGELCRLWGGGIRETDGAEQPHEAHMLCLDCTKAAVELGWRPRLCTAQALRETAAWYRAWSDDPSPEHMREVTLGQIRDYMRTNARPPE